MLGLLDGIVHPNPIRSLLSTMAVSATLTLAVWGATSVPWYWAAGGFFGGAVLAAPVVTRKNRARWQPVSLVLDAVTVAGAVYLWIWHWPFG